MLKALIITAFTMFAPATIAVAHANFPSKPITIVVGFGAGGATDVLARKLAVGLEEILGTSVIVENRPGASSMIAAQYVASAPPDGHTLYMGTAGALVINVHFEPKPNYDPLEDFTPISLLVLNDPVLIARKDFPANNVAELIALAKEAPGKYAFGSSGVGSPTQLAVEQFARAAGIELTHIPYQGDAPSAADVVAGHLDMAVNGIPSVAEFIKAGTVKAIVVFGENRLSAFPDLTTIAEQGYPDLTASTLTGLLAPGGTPAEVIDKLNVATREVMEAPEFNELLEESGSRVETNTPAEFGAHLKSEYAKWQAIIEQAGLGR